MSSLSDLADILGCGIRHIAELPKHLQVTDTADGIPQLRQLLASKYLQGLVSPYMLELKQYKENHQISVIYFMY